MMNYRDLKTGLPLPSWDLWEERRGIMTFTISTVYGGLIAASQFADLFGETELAEEYRRGAHKIRKAIDKYLYLEKEKRFGRMVTFKPDGSFEVDSTIDASLYATFAFGLYEPTDEKVTSTMNQIIETLSSGGGISRYANDPYYRTENQNNPWFICTLWVAQYYIASGQLEKGMEVLEWVADHALPSGVLSEQVNPITHEPVSVSPLTWSHGAFIAAVHEYIDKKLGKERCDKCGQPINSKYI
jgi:GH15 family glucan-1,4-alpha-glucosidase